MSTTSIAFGIVLTILGPVLYAGSDLPPERRATALIPSAFGIALVVCGVIARNDKARKHAMHFAALLGLVGFVMPLVMVIKKYATDGEFKPLSGGGQLAMSALCGVFLALCVKS